jgi:hypothetical protein
MDCCPRAPKVLRVLTERIAELEECAETRVASLPLLKSKQHADD